MASATKKRAAETTAAIPATALSIRASALAELSWLCALVAVPLYFNPRTARVFDTDKMSLVAVFGILAGLALALRWAEGGFEPRRSGKRTLHLGHGLALLAVAFLAGSGLAGLLSEIPQVAIWGAYRRAMGLIGLGAFVLLFLAALLGASDPATRRRFRSFALAPVVPAAAYAILQRLGIDSLQWETYGSTAAERAFGPLGNPIFLGAYLALAFPLAISGWVDAQRDAGLSLARGREAAKLQRYGYALAALFSTAGLLASQSRGPLLGWLAAIGVLALLFSVQLGRSSLARALAAFGGLGLFLLAWASQAGMLGGGRLGGLLSLGSRTVRERMLVWDALESLLRSDPTRAILGYGPDSLAYHLPPHLEAALIQLTPTQYFDRAHNALWEAWISGGLLAVLAYLGLYFLAFGAGYRQLGLLMDRAALGKLLAWMASVAAVGALAPRLLDLSALSAPGLMAGWLAGATGYALSTAGPSSSEAEPQPNTKTKWNPRSAGSILGALQEGDALVIGCLALSSAHGVESALGLPTAAGDLLFWIALGVLGAGLFGGEASPAARGQATGPSTSASRSGALVQSRRKTMAKHADDALPDEGLIADGIVEGLGLATIAMSPILLPSFAAAWDAWPVFLLLPLAWLSLDLLSAPEGWRAERIFARLGVLAAFALAFVPAKASLGGVAIAFALVAASATVAATVARGTGASDKAAAAPGPGRETEPKPWRYLIYATLSALALLGAWRLALRPVVADTHARAALEAVAKGDLDRGLARYESASRIWPEQPLLHVQRAALLDRRMQLAAGDPEAVEQRYADALAALERARGLGEDEVVLLRLAALHQTRGDLERAAGGSPARHWGLARQAYADTERRHPLYPPAIFGRGTLLERLEQYDAAGDAYASAAALDAGMAAARAGALRCALAAGDQAKAIEAAAIALPEGEDPTPLLAQLEPAGTGLPAGPQWAQARAMILARAGRDAEASAALEAAEREAPQHPNLGWLRSWSTAPEGP